MKVSVNLIGVANVNGGNPRAISDVIWSLKEYSIGSEQKTKK